MRESLRDKFGIDDVERLRLHNLGQLALSPKEVATIQGSPAYRQAEALRALMAASIMSANPEVAAWPDSISREPRVIGTDTLFLIGRARRTHTELIGGNNPIVRMPDAGPTPAPNIMQPPAEGIASA